MFYKKCGSSRVYFLFSWAIILFWGLSHLTNSTTRANFFFCNYIFLTLNPKVDFTENVIKDKVNVCQHLFVCYIFLLLLYTKFIHFSLSLWLWLNIQNFMLLCKIWSLKLVTLMISWSNSVILLRQKKFGYMQKEAR